MRSQDFWNFMIFSTSEGNSLYFTTDIFLWQLIHFDAFFDQTDQIILKFTTMKHFSVRKSTKEVEYIQ